MILVLTEDEFLFVEQDLPGEHNGGLYLLGPRLPAKRATLFESKMLSSLGHKVTCL